MEEQLEYSINLESLHLENFRCFQDLNIKFDERLTVFIAENGGGKTAILDAIAEGLKIFLATLKVDGYKTKLLPFKDIKKGLPTARCQLFADIDYLVKDDYPATDNEGNILTDEDGVEQIIESQKKENELVAFTFETAVSKLSYEASFYSQTEPLKSYKDTNLPVLVYYGGDSVHIEYNAKEATSFGKLDRVYDDALSMERFQFTPFYNWWRENEDLMLRIKDKTLPRFKTFDSQFKKLKNAIEFMLNDNPLQPTYTDLRINDELKMGVDKNTYKENGEVDSSLFIDVSQFSAGEKSLFAFVADLGLRLLYATLLQNDEQKDDRQAIREGERDIVVEDKKGTIKGKGIVLIDEVDLHLHPKWQRKVVGKLLDIFPDVQFVMTTHSPGAVQNIPKTSIRVIADGKLSEKQIYTRGRDIESIYFDAFGQEEYPIEQKGLIDKVRDFYDIIDEGEAAELPKAKQIIDDLKEEWGPKDKKIIELETLYDLAIS